LLELARVALPYLSLLALPLQVSVPPLALSVLLPVQPVSEGAQRFLHQTLKKVVRR
jgi:hypothetical protein